MAQRARNDEEREQSLQQLQKGLLRASRLVDQMLQLARLDPQASLPAPGPVDLSSVCAEVCAEIGPEILRKNLEFELQAEPGVTVSGQPDWIRVLVRNLVDNATRYTPDGGVVTVELRRTPTQVVLNVCDSGPGIPAAERDAVLRPFHRLDSGHTGGSGLGLAIVARIASLHQARLTLGDAPGLPGLLATVAWPAPELAAGR